MGDPIQPRKTILSSAVVLYFIIAFEVLIMISPFAGFFYSVFKEGDAVNVFLLASGVECESLDTERFSVTGQMNELVEKGGKILACGTCLKIRNLEGTELCPLSTMKDLYELVRDSDKVVSF